MRRSSLFLSAVLVIAVPATAAQPIRINYQARLTNASDALLTGTHTLYFTLWTSGAASAGVANSGVNVYSETASVAVNNGVASWPVGTGTITSGTLNANLFDTSSDIFLQVAVDTAGNVVLPRTRLESVPFAVRALASDSATNASSLGGVPASSYSRFQWSVVTGATQMASNRGYIADSTSLLTATLPLAPAAGDVVAVTGKGLGGWSVGQNAGQSIRTISAVPAFPSDWQPHESIREWYAVASSADGMKLVVAVYGGQLYISTDGGAIWTPRDSSRDWVAVASSSDGTKLVACVDGGQIYTSPDSGVTWTPRDSSRFWDGVASSSDGVKLVASVFSGQLYTSTDSGATWFPRDSSRQWYSVTSSADGTRLGATVVNGQIYTSPDSGVTWTPRDINRLWYSIASSADGTRMVAAVYTGQVYTSTNAGVTWTPRDSNRSWYSVASSADGMRLVAATYNGQILTSVDGGINWTPRESIRDWLSVASSADGNRLVAVDAGGRIYTSVAQTTTGSSGFLRGASGSAVQLQFIGSGLWTPISHEGVLSAQ